MAKMVLLVLVEGVIHNKVFIYLLLFLPIPILDTVP